MVNIIIIYMLKIIYNTINLYFIIFKGVVLDYFYHILGTPIEDHLNL